MSLINYWPSLTNINQCIRTEAEELAEHTLLAVHEPMQLVRKESFEETLCDESELLKHFLSIDRPIPIIGRSGVGKSHLIRWLNAQLKLQSNASDLHIVRIPKNASLKQVLELLLEGLNGEEFEQARKSVKNVGEKLDTREVAELLLTFMGQQLRKLYEDAVATLQNYKESGIRPDQDEYQRLNTIQCHAGQEGLPSLINDSDYKLNLLKPEHCIYQFASRLTRGASEDELANNDYQIHASDLDFNYSIDDLSLSAREYVKNARLNTSEEARDTAASTLNQILGDATRKAFQQLFHFNGGNFQDLFKQIRRSLHKEGRTLVVLVEDMAAISAIEDVLIDSLLEEGTRDGEDSLCILKSAIAVTDGYPGYVRRQGTIKTRARAEWWIQESVGNESDIVDRITEFCSRYINAARHGSPALEKLRQRSPANWPPAWIDEEVDRQHLDAFGIAKTGFPLYPFSRSAIAALADRYCRDQNDNLQFNPREVLNQILLNVLRDGRNDHENGRFPPAGLAGVYVVGTLRNSLHTLGLEEIQRIEALAAIWGYGAKTFDELKNRLSPDIAAEFGLSELAKHLDSKAVRVTPIVRSNPKPKPSTTQGPVVSPGTRLGIDSIEDTAVQQDRLEEAVDHWFHGKQDLGQNEARDLRNALVKLYEQYAKAEWLGLAKRPLLKNKSIVSIYIPQALGNKVGSDGISFCTDAQFKDPKMSVLFHTAALALIRSEQNSKKDGNDASPSYEDFLTCQNFAARWVPGVLQTLVDRQRVGLDQSIAEQIQSSCALGLFKSSDNSKSKINKLLMSRQSIEVSLPSPSCNSLAELRKSVLEKWEEQREQWLGLVASNDHGLEGDLAIIALKRSIGTRPSRELLRTRDIALKELNDQHQHIQLLSDCQSAEGFSESIDELSDLIRQMQKNGLYKKHDSIPASNTFVKHLQALLEQGHWSAGKTVLELFKSEDVAKQLQLLNQLDGDRLATLYKALANWQVIYSSALPQLKRQNEEWGGDQLASAQVKIDQLLIDLTIVIDLITEATHEHA